MAQIQRTLHTETLELEGTLKYKETSWQQVWHPTLNQGLLLSKLPAHAQQKVYLIKICGTHVAYQSLKSAVCSKTKSWFNCKMCAMWYTRKHDPPAASKAERIVLGIVASQFAPHEFFMDCRIICEKSKVGSVDIWIPKHNLAIMVDGASHFVHKYNTSRSKQRQIDDRFCVCALKHVNVLRIHYGDTFHTARFITDVVTQASKQASHVLYYTPTFYSNKYLDDQHVAEIIAKSAAIPSTDQATVDL